MRGLLAAAIVLALGACEPPREGEAVSRTKIGGVTSATPSPKASATPTPRRASACRQTEFEGVGLTHCIADPARHTIRTVLGTNNATPYRSLAALKNALGDDAAKVAFAMNAGMFDGEGDPIGYYVEDGERLQELNRTEGGGNFHMLPNGVLYGGGGRWRVLTAEQFYATVGDRPRFGTQSGPMLVIDGELHPEFQEDGPSERIRNGVGIDAAGRAHFVISEMPLSFGRLARYFRDVLKTTNALYLDGSVSALWDPGAGRIDGGAPIGPILLIENKE